jgi:UDP-N-acetylglucosamine 4-epimerase
LHQAALGSVPRSIKDPCTSNDVNVSGTVNLLNVAQAAGIKRFVYASSSSVYGENPELPRRESQRCEPLSPYASSKMAGEVYARAFANCYGITTVGLRYFNVFGPRQNPDGPYAAVIPLWVKSLIEDEKIFINGDGETSRDFCFVENVVEANLKAAAAELSPGSSHIMNIACGGRTTLNQLHTYICGELAALGGKFAGVKAKKPEYRDFRAGDVRHSHADIAIAQKTIGYEVRFDVRQGLTKSIGWYVDNLG